MKQQIGIAATCLALTLGLACGVAAAQDFGKLGGMLSGGGMSSGSMGNVAGLLSYCVKNNYLGGSSGVQGVQNQLMSKLGGTSGKSKSSGASGMLGQLTSHRDSRVEPAASDPGYLAGAKGMLTSSSGKTTDLSSLGGGSSELKSKLTEKVCSTVLKQGKSFIGM